MSNIQKLIHYLFPIPILRSNFTISQRSLQFSLQNREIPSHPLSMPQQSELPAHGWSLCTCARGSSSSPRCAKSRSGTHVRPSHAKSDTPRCPVISTLYCCRPRPASCTTSQCHRRWHRHCPCRARWCIDRSSHPLFSMKMALLTVQNCAQVHRKRTGDLVPFHQRGFSKICQSKDRKQTTKVLYLTYRSNPMWSIDCIKVKHTWKGVWITST
jgi:hypothetical protein